MANTKELQNRIKSVRDTLKITKAMYMMSSMKLRKARQMLENTEPYFYGLQEQIREILLHFPDLQHIYFDNRNQDLAETEKRTAFIVISGDKGMAGAYNHNVIKEAQTRLDKEECYKLFVVGEVGRRHFANYGYVLDSDLIFPATNPSLHRARIIAENVVELYKEGEIDAVYVIYTRMINSINSVVETTQLLPLKTHEFVARELLEEARQKRGTVSEEEAVSDEWFYIHPSPQVVLEKLAYNYMTGFLYGALVEGNASEENARMIAMQSATDNADEMLRALSMEYNRVRQAAITQEITEVIGGAKALKKKKKKQKGEISHYGEQR